MPIIYPDILSEESARREFSYSSRDAILYALGIGLGEDEGDLPFVYEKDLQVVPTAATVLSGTIMPALTPGNGRRKSTLDFAKVVHGEQKTVLHRPLTAGDALFTQTRTIGAYDKGPERGAIIVTETRWSDKGDRDVATLTNTFFARGDGGFGGPASLEASQYSPPDRAPDHSIKISTRKDQALLYRLSGDSNPLHADPEAARLAGFPGPILHGLCTYGITCRAILQAVVDNDASRIFSHQVRFSAPVYPGETLRIDLWVEGDAVQFEAVALDRNVTVIRSGRTVLRNPQRGADDQSNGSQSRVSAVAAG